MGDAVIRHTSPTCILNIANRPRRLSTWIEILNRHELLLATIHSNTRSHPPSSWNIKKLIPRAIIGLLIHSGGYTGFLTTTSVVTFELPLTTPHPFIAHTSTLPL